MTTKKLYCKEVRSVPVESWDRLVQEVYRRPYKFQQQDGCQSRGTYSFTVPIKHPEDYEPYSEKRFIEKVNELEMGVSFSDWLSRDPNQPLKSVSGYPETDQWRLELWWKRNFYPNIEMLIDDLWGRGILEEGEYVIDIDW